MNTFLARDVIGWGFVLWLIGYVLGFVFHALVAPALIGWYVMPLGIAVTCLVLWRRFRVVPLRDAALLGIGTARCVARRRCSLTEMYNLTDPGL